MTTRLGVQHPEHVRRGSTSTWSPSARATTPPTTPRPSRRRSRRSTHYQEWDSGYSTQQATRPQTLGYGLVDSPAGQAAWVLEKFWSWADHGGHPEDA